MKIETLYTLKSVIAAEQDRLEAINRRLKTMKSEVTNATSQGQLDAIQFELDELKEETSSLLKNIAKHREMVQSFYKRG